MYYIYILRCRDQSLYIGITTDVIKRYKQHSQKKGAKYTKSHPPISIEAIWKCKDRSIASKLEYWLKKLSKIQKENLLCYPELFDEYLKEHLDTHLYQVMDVSSINKHIS